MAEPVGQWRATYAPGDWVVLAGPTSVVVLEPASGAWSSLIGAIWTEVVNASSITELAGAFAAYQLDTMPSFGAFFWTEEGMRSLVRGAVEVVDAASGDVVASGEGIQTWSEVGLSGVRQVRLELPGTAAEDASASEDPQTSEDDPLELPLVVGAALAGRVMLDCSDEAQVYSPQGAGAAESIAAESGEEDPGAEDAEESDPPKGETLAEDEGEPTQLYSEEPTSRTDPDGPAQLLPVPDVAPGPAPPAAAVPVIAAAPIADPMLDEIENGDTQMMSPAVPGSPEPLQDVSEQSMIMAVVCPYGHTSPQNATQCRVCGSPIGPQAPQLVPRPPLAVLKASDGSSAPVDRAVLVGRAPSADRSMARAPRLLTVPSPGHDISRTHLEIAPDGWQITVTDLQSTNGTLAIAPQSGMRQPLPPQQPTAVDIGTVLELGDGITVLIDAPDSAQPG